MRYAVDVGSTGLRHDAQSDMNRLSYSKQNQTAHFEHERDPGRDRSADSSQ